MITRRRFLLGLAPAMLVQPHSASAAFEKPAVLVREAIARGELPGAALHIRMGGRPPYEEAFGRARIEDDVALIPHHLFPVASLTKAVVAAAILQLAEAGRLRVDDPITRFVPEFANPHVLVTY